MEKSPWWKSIEGPLPTWQGAVGVKDDGGGSIRGQGKVGDMRVHRAVCNRRAEDIRQLVEQGENVNEVDAAGNTPLHLAAFEGWVEGAELLLALGAKVNASNNAGDRPWHWAKNLEQEMVLATLEQHGASKQRGSVLVPEHIPKVKDFYLKDCWAAHPLPYADFLEFKKKEYQQMEAERKSIIRG